MAVRRTPIHTVLDLLEHSDFHVKESSNTNVYYKDLNVGTMFYSGKDKYKFSLSFIPGSDLEQYLSNEWKIDSSYGGGHNVVWFNLFRGEQVPELLKVFKELPRFEDSLRTNFQRRGTDNSIKREDTGFWMFNANPKIWDIKKWLSEKEEGYITINDYHRDRIKEGNIGIIRSGKDISKSIDNGIYAIIKITGIAERNSDEQRWKVPVKVIHNLKDEPIVLPIKDIDSLDEYNVNNGQQGSSFVINKGTYEKILNLVSMREKVNI